jgi:predicted RNA-binding protein Jag
MKSIVEEASSISKAIENAWKRADQPTEFSVRIHELPQKNMFGFTSKPAKIALFFPEESKKTGTHKTVSHTSSTNPIPAVSKPVTVKAQPKKIVPQQAQPQKPVKPTPTTPAEPKPARQETAEPWSPEMVTYAETWLKELLQKLEIKNADFQTTPQRYHLKISFTNPIFPEDEKNRALFRNCAHLILQATRNAFKRPLKGFKAILTTEQLQS